MRLRLRLLLLRLLRLLRLLPLLSRPLQHDLGERSRRQHLALPCPGSPQTQCRCGGEVLFWILAQRPMQLQAVLVFLLLLPLAVVGDCPLETRILFESCQACDLLQTLHDASRSLQRLRLQQ